MMPQRKRAGLMTQKSIDQIYILQLQFQGNLLPGLISQAHFKFIKLISLKECYNTYYSTISSKRTNGKKVIKIYRKKIIIQCNLISCSREDVLTFLLTDECTIQLDQETKFCKFLFASHDTAAEACWSHNTRGR